VDGLAAVVVSCRWGLFRADAMRVTRMPAPPEWGPLPESMYTSYYHNIGSLPAGAGDSEHAEFRTVEGLDPPVAEGKQGAAGKEESKGEEEPEEF
jgi:hypothetical protein